jgi:NAD(P)-dependent dehydrogenase (short-subunit alcohol dehydrogenase family)
MNIPINTYPDLPSFCERTVVVTGAGRGIGRSIAVLFAKLGARVIIAEVSSSGKEVEKEIDVAGGKAVFIQTDVSDESSVSNLVSCTRQAFGPVDVLVNNAILCPFSLVKDMPVDLWDRVQAVNLRGTFLVSQACLPDMLARGKGTIINMISTEAMPGLSAYIASKQGILGFSQTLAAEVGPMGIHVITFAPGMVDTPGIREVAQQLAHELGIAEEEFLNLSLHPAYQGLMPVEHAALAAAYLAGTYAEEYAGESVDGYTVLERAGVISSFMGLRTGSKFEKERGSAKNTVDASNAVEKAINLNRQVENFLAETDSEFNQLPFFARPMARSGFSRKAEQRLLTAPTRLDTIFGRILCTIGKPANPGFCDDR